MVTMGRRNRGIPDDRTIPLRVYHSSKYLAEPSLSDMRIGPSSIDIAARICVGIHVNLLWTDLFGLQGLELSDILSPFGDKIRAQVFAQLS